jgi:hypothetical protein
MAKVDVPICLRRCANAQHHNISLAKSFIIQRSSLKPPRGNIFLDKVIQPGLEKRRLRLPNRFHFIHVAVNPEHIVPNFSQTGGAHTANVSQAHHDYVLLGIYIRQHNLTRGEFIMELRTAIE